MVIRKASRSAHQTLRSIHYYEFNGCYHLNLCLCFASYLTLMYTVKTHQVIFYPAVVILCHKCGKLKAILNKKWHFKSRVDKCFCSKKKKEIDAEHLVFAVVLEQQKFPCLQKSPGGFFLSHAFALRLSLYQGHAGDTRGNHDCSCWKS